MTAVRSDQRSQRLGTLLENLERNPAMTSDDLHALARALNNYEMTAERKISLASEISGYLRTLEEYRTRLLFDDAPADFDLVLIAESANEAR